MKVKILIMGILITSLTFSSEIKVTVPMPLVKGKNKKNSADLEKSKIAIDEKKIEIRKELLKDKPDWKKIEKYNIEIATQEAINKTSGMKEKFEGINKALVPVK